MGYKSVENVMKHSASRGTDRLVLMVLATHADDETGECYPSRDLLCQESAMAERNLIYCLNRLEALGEIAIHRGNGRGNLTAYKLTFSAAQKPERMQSLASFSEDKKGAKSGEKGAMERVQNPVERVQDFAERVQDSAIKGAKHTGAYKDIEPSGNHQEPSGEPEEGTTSAPTSPATATEHSTSEAVTKDHPAIVTIRSLTNRYPDKALWPRIASVLGSEFDSTRLLDCYATWIERGYNKMNFAWLFSWYVEGIPTEQQGRGRASPRPSIAEINAANAAEATRRTLERMRND